MTDMQESDGQITIAIFVDPHSKIIDFAPCTKEVKTDKYAQIFICDVSKQHDVPEIFISN